MSLYGIRIDLPQEILDFLANNDEACNRCFVAGLTTALVGLTALIVVQLWSKK